MITFNNQREQKRKKKKLKTQNLIALTQSRVLKNTNN